MNYKRRLQASLLEQLSRPAMVIHVMIGPRQMGKTTIARQIQDAIRVYRPDEFEKRLAMGDPFLEMVVSEGKVLYG